MDWTDIAIITVVSSCPWGNSAITLTRRDQKVGQFQPSFHLLITPTQTEKSEFWTRWEEGGRSQLELLLPRVWWSFWQIGLWISYYFGQQAAVAPAWSNWPGFVSEWCGKFFSPDSTCLAGSSKVGDFADNLGAVWQPAGAHTVCDGSNC